MRFRNLRIAFSVVCGIACLLLIALWVRSYWWEDGIQGPILWPNGFSLTSVNGRLMLGGADADDPVAAWDSYSFKFDDPHGAGWIGEFLGPVFAYHPSEEDGAYIHVPHWFLALITGSIAFVLARRRRYSLRTLLIVMTLVAVGLGLIAYYSTHAKAGGGGGLAYDCRGKELPSLPRLI